MASITENYNALLQLPLVRKLMLRNARLKHENNVMKSIIHSMPEFRCDCKKTNKQKKGGVSIKKEKEDNEPVQCDTQDEDDDIIYVQEPEVRKINIVYEINEQEEEVEQEEEEVEAVEEETVEEEAKEVETEEVEEEEEEEEEEAQEEEEEEEQAQEEEEEAEEEVFVITISGKSYYTSDKENGKIYAIDENEDVGTEIGEFKKGKAKFY